MPAPIDAQSDSSTPVPPASKPQTGRQSIARWLTPILLALLATAFLYRAPYNASALEIVPDSVEYAVGAQRIALLGRYDIEINHVAYPPRYAPWFSLILAPVYGMTQGAMGSGILVVFAFALAGAVALYAIGCRLVAEWKGMQAEWGGAGAVLCLLSFKEYRTLARYIMTDVPAAVAGFCCCLLYMKMQARREARDYVLAGLLAGLAAALRYEGFVLLLPFVALLWKSGPGKWKNLVLLCAPVVCVTCATALYNARTFGSWRRSGYHFWTAVPYDYPALVWSPHYIGHNFFVLSAKQSVLIMGVGLIGCLLLRRRANPELRSALRFLGWACIPLGVAHLFYFSSSVRFYLLALTLWGAIGGAGLATLLPLKWTRSPRWLVCGLAAALLATPYIHHAFDSEPKRRQDADAMARLTPADAVIVTDLDAVYLEPFVLRGTQRRIIPLTRQVEYASKTIVLERIPHPEPPPRHISDGRSPGMLAGGAQDVIAFTAEEAPGKITALIRAGVPVYVDLRFAPETLNVRALFRGAELTDIREYAWLKQLRVPSAHTDSR